MNSPYETLVAQWRAQDIRSEADLARALGVFPAAFAFHSGRMDNDRVARKDAEDIFARDALSSYTGDLCTVFELHGAKRAHRYLLSAFGAGAPLNEAFLLEVQRISTLNTYEFLPYLLGERPGTYKKHEYTMGRIRAAVAPENAKAELLDLLTAVRAVSDEEVPDAAAWFHAGLEGIHPFAFGNGRTGRLALNYLLLIHNYPPVILHAEDKADYLAALQHWDIHRDWTPMRTFLEDQAVKTWKTTLPAWDAGETS